MILFNEPSSPDSTYDSFHPELQRSDARRGEATRPRSYSFPVAELELHQLLPFPGCSMGLCSLL